MRQGNRNAAITNPVSLSRVHEQMGELSISLSRP